MLADKFWEKKMKKKKFHPSSHWRKESDLDPLVRGSDPHQNVTDPQHWLKKIEINVNFNFIMVIEYLDFKEFFSLSYIL